MKTESRKRVSIVSIKMVKERTEFYSKRKIKSPDDCYEILKNFMEGFDREHFVLMCLSTKNEPTLLEIVSVGSLNAAVIHPREVFKSAILSNSSSIIVAHNHPSGDPTPSREDIQITDRLVECGKILGIELLDHLILGDDGYFSLKENGKI